MTKLDTNKLSRLHDQILKFNADRGWDPSAQNIAKSVVIEAAELLEHFQWDSQDYGPKDKNIKEIGFEIADVIWYLFNLANKLEINLVDAIEHKFEHNAAKYPIEKFNGHHNPDFYYAQKKKYREEKK